MPKRNIVTMPPLDKVVDGIPFRLKRGSEEDVVTECCGEYNLLAHGLVYRCHFPLYKYGYERDGIKWIPGRENRIQERLSTAVLQWSGGRVAVQFQSSHSAYVIAAESLSDRLFRLIFLWERDVATRPRGRYYHLGAFLEWLGQRVDAGEKLTHDKPFLFEDWQEHGPYDERFQKVRIRREQLKAAGDTNVVIEAASMALKSASLEDNGPVSGLTLR